FLLIVNRFDVEQLDVHDIPAFLRNLLVRVDWRRDLHFQTKTTIDTLDYSGDALNMGSKVVIAAAGPPIRELPSELPSDLTLPEGFKTPRLVLPGIIAVEGLPATTPQSALRTPQSESTEISRFCAAIPGEDPLRRFPLIVIVDDSNFASWSLANFLWVTFTR